MEKELDELKAMRRNSLKKSSHSISILSGASAINNAAV
jgi:hypothetical protein